MADLDPFGRKKGEDPLESLGWSSSGSEPAADVAPDRRESADERPLAGFGRERDPRPEPTSAPRERTARREPEAPAPAGAARAVRGLVILVILVAVGGFALAAVGTGVDKVTRVVREFTTPQVASESPSSEVPSGARQPTLQAPPAARAAAPPRGLGRGSLLRPYAFGAAVKRLRSGGYGRPTHLRVAPERIDATMLTGRGVLRNIQIVSAGSARQLGPDIKGFRGVPTLSLKGIDAGAPQRLTRAAAGRLRIAPSRVNYLVYSQFADTAQWYVYFTAGQIFAADAHGRITRRVS